MNLKKVMVSLATAMTATAMMLTTMPAAQVSAATIKNDQSKISMYSRESNYVYHGSYEYSNYIKVAKNISGGKVYLNYKDNKGDWEKKEASYLNSLDNNYNIYEVSYGEFGRLPECYVSCEANGDTFIDDNNGKYYVDQKLGEAAICAARSYNRMLGNSWYDINAVVKNLAYQKDVRVRYTLDNWKTYKEASLKYQSTNEDGTEFWNTDIDTQGTNHENFHYALSYTVNGVTYWDNNFGRNYDSYFHHEN